MSTELVSNQKIVLGPGVCTVEIEAPQQQYVIPARTQVHLMLRSPRNPDRANYHIKFVLSEYSVCKFEWVEDLSSIVKELHMQIEYVLEDGATLESVQIHAPQSNRSINEHYILHNKSQVHIACLVFQKYSQVYFSYLPKVLHSGEGCSSDIKVRSLLAGDTSTTLAGCMRLDRNASAVAHYHNHNLMVFGLPALTAQPDLEIDFDRVQCTHGVTLGQLDPQALFYMEARGLAQEEAQNILMRSFIRADMDRIMSAYDSIIDPLVNTFFDRSAS